MVSISSNIFVFSFFIIVFSGFIIPLMTENKYARYLIILFLIYILNYLLIALSTAEQGCQPNKIKYSYLLIQSLWAPLLSIIVLGIINIDIMNSFLIKPFKNLLDGDNKDSSLGEYIGESVNLIGICLSAQLITYYNVLNNGCSP